MIDRATFDSLLCKFAKTQVVSDDDVLFGRGLDISSIAFTEFIMELEEEAGIDIDIDDLDASIRNVGELFARLSRY